MRYYRCLTKGFFTTRLLSTLKIKMCFANIQVRDMVCNISQTNLTV